MDNMTAVENGAAVLDREVPGWIFLINLDTLDLEDCNRCVLGQVFGGFWTGMATLFDDAASPEVAVTCGFEIEGVSDEDYTELTDAWISFVDQRVAQSEGF